MLTKDLINNIATATGFTKKRVDELLNATQSVVVENLLGGKSVQLQGLGVLEVKDKNERVIVHPKTGERTTVPAKKQLNFRPISALKDELKNL